MSLDFFAPGATAEVTYHCPMCNVVLPFVQRYPHYLCSNCCSRATDSNARRVYMYNRGLGGGFVAYYDEQCNEEAKQVSETGCVWVDGKKCEAGEARFGGIVVQHNPVSTRG